ncbi:MAG: small subunit ribosomal protein S1 [Flammeovirgaceae bacterium]|jgi:small subunit ribosomal protein S1
MANDEKKVSEETKNTQVAAESKPAETQEKVTESTEETAKAEEPKAEVTEETPKTEASAETTEAKPVAEAGEPAEEATAETPAEDKDADPDGNDIVTRLKEEAVGRDDEEGDELNLYEGQEEFDAANFDWDKFEHGAQDYEEKERAELDEMYSDTLNAVQQGEVVKGTVVDITKKEVVVNINYKSEGIVTANEFRYNEELAIGDTVDVYVESLEDKNGQLDISHKTARMHEAWRKVNLALEEDTIITGNIKCRTKGGLIADVFGLEAFLPGSQIDVKPIRDYDMYVGKKMEFKVVKINHEFKNVVVSHKALIEAELEEQKKQIIGGLEKGQVLEGTVKNITSYGVFIDLGGVDGLIHITDLSWGRINHPEEVVELDQKINVVILDFDDDKKRIALGLKQLTDHPWDTISDETQVGSKMKGKVVVIADYGAFVEIAPGVEGLVHVSEMSWSQHLRSAQDFLNVGDEIDTVVLSIDRDERKMSLGIKQLMPDPWASIVEKYPVGSKHKASVRNFTNFGIFVELEEGIDGLVHISDLSWSKKIKHPSEFCTIGDDLEVVVLEVDQDNRRLSLGHKQLEENPWDVFESVFLEGSKHEGTVTAIENNTATIAMPYGVEAVAPAKHLTKADGSSIKIDDRAEFVVLEFNKNQRRIMVSHTRTFEEDPKLGKIKEVAERKASTKAASKAIQNIQKGQEKTTLGDLDVLAGLKNEMEKDEKAASAEAVKKSAENKEEKS